MQRITERRGLHMKSQEKTDRYLQKLDCCFNLRYFLQKRNLTPCLQYLEKQKSEPEDDEPTFAEMYCHFDELESQARYEISLRNISALTLHNAISDE